MRGRVERVSRRYLYYSSHNDRMRRTSSVDCMLAMTDSYVDDKVRSLVLSYSVEKKVRQGQGCMEVHLPHPPKAEPQKKSLLSALPAIQHFLEKWTPPQLQAPS